MKESAPKHEAEQCVSLGVVLGLLIGTVTAFLAPTGISTAFGSLFLVAGIIIAAIFIGYREGQYRLFDSDVLLLSSFMLYSLPGPMALLFSPDGLESPEIVTKAVIVESIGMMFLLVGTKVGRHSRLHYLLPQLKERRWNTNRIVIILVFNGTVVFGGTFWLFMSLGGLSSLSTLTLGERYVELQGAGPLLALSFQAYPFFLLLYEFACWKNRRIFWLIYIVSIIAFIIPYILFGRRYELVAAVLVLLAYRDFTRKRIKMLSFMTLGLVGFVVTLSMGAFRLGLESRDVVSAIGWLADNFSWTWFSVSRTEIATRFTILVQVLERVPHVWEFQLGRTYLNAVALLIPRAIDPDRPIPISEFITAELAPDLYQRGGGLAFSAFAEQYFNFGLIGVCGGMLILGLMAGTWAKYLQRLKSRDAYFIASLLTPLWFRFPRNDFATDLKGHLVISLIPALVIVFLLRQGASSERKVVVAGDADE